MLGNVRVFDHRVERCIIGLVEEADHLQLFEDVLGSCLAAVVWGVGAV